jgi:hypothetical protein
MMKKINYTLYIYVLAAFVVLAGMGCSEDYLNTSPSTEISVDEMYKDMQTAEMALNGIYRHFYQYIGSHEQGGHWSMLLAIDLMGEDLFPIQEGYLWFVPDYNYTGSRNANSARVAYFWSYYYDIINNANILIKRLPETPGTTADRNRLMGQALALRAFGHFMEVQFFAKTYKGNEHEPGVPVYTEPTSIGKARATVGEVYEQIVADLDSAMVKLTGATARANKSYMNLQVVQGLRARVALVMEDWRVAEDYAREARTGFELMRITNSDLSTLLRLRDGDGMNSVEYLNGYRPAIGYLGGFNSANNTEWMWGSIINDEQSIVLASLYSHLDPLAGGYATVGNEKHILRDLYDRIPPTDIRHYCFVNTTYKYFSGFPNSFNYCTVKFHLAGSSLAGDNVYMRAAEMYLIEAEAIAQQQTGRAEEARTLLTTLVKTRNESYNINNTLLTGTALLEEIYLQRRIELWGEGFRWTDLKRQKSALVRPVVSNTVADPSPGMHRGPLANNVISVPVDDARWTILIPQNELDANPNMTQNPL